MLLRRPQAARRRRAAPAGGRVQLHAARPLRANVRGGRLRRLGGQGARPRRLRDAAPPGGPRAAGRGAHQGGLAGVPAGHRRPRPPLRADDQRGLRRAVLEPAAARGARPAGDPAGRAALASEERMRIGISCYPTYGGSGVVATELAMALAAGGDDVHVISYALPSRLALLETEHPEARLFFHQVVVPHYPLFEYPPYSQALATKMVEITR